METRESDQSSRQALGLAIGVLAVVGAAISVYLLIVSVVLARLPAGCGAGSGCASVLTSRWAGAFGIPVSAPAALAYVTALIAVFFTSERRASRGRRAAWSVLLALAIVIGLAAVWFIALQIFVLKAICPWCMGSHAVGLLLCAAVFIAAPTPRTRLRVLGAAALLVIGLTIAAQFIAPYRPATLVRLPPGANADIGRGEDRLIQLLDGRLPLAPHDEPLLGSPDATHILVVMLDYCCPHCQATHGDLVQMMAQRPERFAILVMPMPMNSRCNPSVAETEPRFEHACELAKLALAVWRADATKFAEFDRWLFESDSPRLPEEARDKAVALVGAAPLERALADDWIDRQIARNVGAYQASGAERIPVLMAVGLATVVGRSDGPEALAALLDELDVQSPASGGR